MRIGSYEIEGVLGRGGVGTVYRARGPDGRLVAVKLLAGTQGDVRTAFGRFARERRLQAGLGLEAGFVPLIDAGDDPSGAWLAMPLVPGGTLGERLRREGRMPTTEAVHLAVAIARAMEFAHEAGIIHRDLKPENILFAADGRPLVADLGLAKHIDPDLSISRSFALSNTGAFAGTLGYMAPEQLRDAKSAGPAADVFAIAAVLFECLAGRQVYQVETPMELLAAAASASVDRLRSIDPNVPAWLDEVVARALDRDPAKRFADAGELARALRRGARGDTVVERGRAGGTIAVLGASVVALVVVLAAGAGLYRAAAPTSGSGGAEAPRSIPSSSAAGGSEVSDSSAGAGATEPAPETVPEALVGLIEYDSVARGARDVLTLDAVLGSGQWRHPEAILSVDISADGTLVASASVEGEVAVREVETGRRRLATVGRRVVLTPDGRHAFVWSPSPLRFSVYDLELPADEVGTPVATRRSDGPIAGLAVAPDGGSVAVARESGILASVTLPDLERVMGHPRHRDGIVSLARSWNGKRIAALSTEGLAMVADFGGDVVGMRLIEGTHRIALSADGELAALTYEREAKAYLWGIAPGRQSTRTVPLPGPARAVAFVPGSGVVLLGGEDGVVRRWDLETDEVSVVHRGHRGPVAVIAVDDLGARVVSGGDDGAVRVWEYASGELVTPRPPGHEGRVFALDVADDGASLVSAGRGSFLCSWDARTGEPLATREFASTLRDVAIAPGGAEVAALVLTQGLVFIGRVDVRTGAVTARGARLTTRFERIAVRADRRVVLEGSGGIAVFDAVDPDDPEAAATGVELAESPPVVALGSPAAPPIRGVALTLGDEGAVADVITESGQVLRFDIRGDVPGDRRVIGADPVGSLVKAAATTGRAIAVREEDRALVRLDWDEDEVTATRIHDVPWAPEVSIRLALSDDGRVGAMAPLALGGVVLVIDVESGAEIDRVALPSVAASALALSPDGETLFVGTGRGPILRYRIARE